MGPGARLTSLTTVELPDDRLHEALYEQGWTDGLPVVAPTPDLVEEMVAAGGWHPETVLGSVPARAISLTVEQVAANAVLAGCPPACFPVVVAATRAMLSPEFSVHNVVASTGGTALCTIVSGPLADRLGIASRTNALGSGWRANATIGRTLRLVAVNLLKSVPGSTDGSSLGHPGKYSLCFAEHDQPAFEPLRVELGFAPEDTTVTLLATEGPRQISNFLTTDPERLLRTCAATMRCPGIYGVGKRMQGALVLGHEHGIAIQEAGWSRADVQAFLMDACRIAPAEIEAAGVLLEHDTSHDMTPDADGLLTTFEHPGDIVLVTAGGPGAGFSAYLPYWAPKNHSVAATCRVDDEEHAR